MDKIGDIIQHIYISKSWDCEWHRFYVQVRFYDKYLVMIAKDLLRGKHFVAIFSLSEQNIH